MKIISRYIKAVEMSWKNSYFDKMKNVLFFALIQGFNICENLIARI